MISSPPVPVSHSWLFQHSIALSINAVSASVLSPNSASGPVAPVAVPVSAGPVGVPSSSSPPPHAAATKASAAMTAAILIRCMFLLPALPNPHRGSIVFVTCLPLSSRCCSRGIVDGRRPRDIRVSPLPKYLLDAADDAIARDEHAADDDEAEHHEPERGGQAHRPQHLVQTGEEEGGHERGQRAGQTPRQGGPPDHHG